MGEEAKVIVNSKGKKKKIGIIIKVVLALILGIMIFAVLHFGYVKSEDYKGEDIYKDIKE